jgi:hypothetical protein
MAVGGRGDQKRRQTPIHTDPPAAVARTAGEVRLGGVQVGGLHVQRQPPAAAVVGDGGEQDLGPAVGEHAP